MNRQELVTVIAEKVGSSKKDADTFVSAFTETISGELKKGNSVQLVGFGTFEVIEKAARDGRNPATGQPMKIAASKAPKFKPGKSLKDLVNGK